MPLLQLGRHCPGRKPAPLALWCCLAILITVGLFLSARSEFVVPVRVPFTAMARPPGRSASHQAALASRAVMFSRNFRVITRGVKFSSHARAMLVSFHLFRHQIWFRKCLAMCSQTLDEPRMNKTAELGIATAIAHLASPPLWSHYAASWNMRGGTWSSHPLGLSCHWTWAALMRFSSHCHLQCFSGLSRKPKWSRFCIALPLPASGSLN